MRRIGLILMMIGVPLVASRSGTQQPPSATVAMNSISTTGATISGETVGTDLVGSKVMIVRQRGADDLAPWSAARIVGAIPAHNAISAEYSHGFDLFTGRSVLTPSPKAKLAFPAPSGIMLAFALQGGPALTPAINRSGEVQQTEPSAIACTGDAVTRQGCNLRGWLLCLQAQKGHASWPRRGQHYPAATNSTSSHLVVSTNSGSPLNAGRESGFSQQGRSHEGENPLCHQGPFADANAPASATPVEQTAQIEPTGQSERRAPHCNKTRQWFAPTSSCSVSRGSIQHHDSSC